MSGYSMRVHDDCHKDHHYDTTIPRSDLIKMGDLAK